MAAFRSPVKLYLTLVKPGDYFAMTRLQKIVTALVRLYCSNIVACSWYWFRVRGIVSFAFSTVLLRGMEPFVSDLLPYPIFVISTTSTEGELISGGVLAIVKYGPSSF